MLVKISKEILEKYPKLQIGYVVAKFKVKEQDPYTENLKNQLETVLNANNINKDTFEKHSSIANWRQVFTDMGKNPKNQTRNALLKH